MLNFFYLTFLILLMSCSTNESLVNYNQNPEELINLEGSWEYTAKHDAQKDLDAVINRIIGKNSKKNIFSSSANQKNNRNSDYVAHLFLRDAKRIKITQTRFAIYIDFNRSIVEEYKNNRVEIIELGEVKAQRSSGWQNDLYLIDTLDDRGMKITETYSLVNQDKNLQRQVIIRDKNANEVIFRRLYVRKN